LGYIFWATAKGLLIGLLIVHGNGETVLDTKNSNSRPVIYMWVWPFVVVLLLCSGVIYHSVAEHLQGITESPITLPVPLREFPLEVAGWAGQEVPIPIAVQKVAGNDDFLSRLYINKTANQWVSIYVAYTARPRTMLGHRPQVCYAAYGWTHDGTDHKKVISRRGLGVPGLLHRFHRLAPNHEETLVLNFYIVNGQLTDDESVFSGVGWRTPNIGGDPARYVAQVQISSVLENSVLTAAKDFTDLILDYFPDEKGEVRNQKSEVRNRKR
jgi:hypothetical protein